MHIIPCFSCIFFVVILAFVLLGLVCDLHVNYLFLFASQSTDVKKKEKETSVLVDKIEKELLVLW